MKRFALLFNQLPGYRLDRIPFIVDNFDKIPLIIDDLDFDELNEYEAIYMYIVSGSNPEWYTKYCIWSDIPILLRKNGVTNPKFMYQLDYFGSDLTKFNYPQVLPHIDCILDLMYWQHDPPLDVPIYYVTFPIDMEEDVKTWRNHDEKINRLVALDRHYGFPEPMIDLANEIEMKIDILGYNTPKVYGLEYSTFIAERMVGLDYHTAGITWSRFAAEAAYCGTPIIGPPEYTAIGIANPELAVPYEEAQPLLERLLGDEDFYIECQETALNNITKHLDPEVCGKRYRYAMRKVGIDV